MAALDPFQIEQLAEELHGILAGQRLLQCFSIDKERVYFQFETHVLHLHFFRGHAYVQLVSPDHLPKRNRLLQFKPAHGLLLTDVKAAYLDRILQMRFEGMSCYLRLFGRFAQLDLYQDNDQLESFPKGRKAYPDPPLERDPVQPSTLEDALTHKWLNDQEVSMLHEADLNNTLSTTWEQVLKIRRMRKWRSDPDADWALRETQEDGTLLDALDVQARRFIPAALKEEAKGVLVQNMEKNLAKYAQRIRKVERNLQSLQTKRSEKEKADLLMAYMHQVKLGDKQVELPDFVDGSPVKIKLNPTLSPQDNAQHFYEKAKDEQKRTSYLAQTLKELKMQQAELEQELEALRSEEDARKLKRSAGALSKKAPVLPYRPMEIEGYEIRIGKSAKDNDQLLRSFSSPHDLWFHAHAVSGSHVILRLKKGQQVPDQIIQKTASVAAFYSKAKSEQWVRVIYSQRKYVRKPRKANPGAVLVEKETSVLVEPVLP